MLKTERTSVMNLENAIRGARNPMNSWAKSDSRFDEAGQFVLGPADLALAERLCRAGSDHRKFIRQIFVSVDITAPLYWWKEFDTYKVGTVANSTSTMHKLHAKPIEASDFSIDRLTDESRAAFDSYLAWIEQVRQRYLETGERKWWDDLIQLLPSSYNQMRTVTMNYENLRNIYFARRNHKLPEWHTLCGWILTLPYAEALITAESAER
ncbi:MAG: hypothetical protein MR018_07430 [Clostridiales bacterium]|nr:hypothetical protein [Clostridiales bacterium]MDD7310038.1 hypothetical protein [Eubacteriales bacterium]MDY5347680.1 hypothetical protein [Eubacteriales bacterium]